MMTFKSEIIKYMNNGVPFINTNFKDIPELPGIYLVGLKKGVKDITILDDTTAIKFYKGKDMIFHNIDELYDKWLQGNREILYIGYTHGLKTRIRTLKKYSRGENVPHRGGRALWQVDKWQDIYQLYWTVTNDVGLKGRLLGFHLDDYGCLPFANDRNY